MDIRKYTETKIKHDISDDRSFRQLAISGAWNQNQGACKSIAIVWISWTRP